MENIVIVITSGAISALVSFISIFSMLGKYREKIDSSEKALVAYGQKIDSLSDRISRMEGGVERDRANSPYVQRKSPLSLTESGKALLLDSKGNLYVDVNKQELIDAIRSASPKTTYDVQELSRKILESRSNDDSFNEIKNFAFEEGLELRDIIDVMGVYLRDMALPEVKLQYPKILMSA